MTDDSMALADLPFAPFAAIARSPSRPFVERGDQGLEPLLVRRVKRGTERDGCQAPTRRPLNVSADVPHEGVREAPVDLPCLRPTGGFPESLVSLVSKDCAWT